MKQKITQEFQDQEDMIQYNCTKTSIILLFVFFGIWQGDICLNVNCKKMTTMRLIIEFSDVYLMVDFDSVLVECCRCIIKV